MPEFSRLVDSFGMTARHDNDSDGEALVSIKIRAFILVLAFGALPLAAQVHDARPQRGKPVYDQETLHAVPHSFSAMWIQADVIAKVKIHSSQIQADLGPSPVPRIRTLHHAKIVKIYKGDLSPGSAIDFSQVAGELETPDFIVRVTDETPLAPGVYIVFLKRGQPATSLFLVGDVDGAYKIRNGYIEPEGKFTSFAKEQRGLSEQRFLEELDTVRRLEKRQR